MSKLFFDAVMEEVVKKIEGLEVDLLSVEYGKKETRTEMKNHTREWRWKFQEEMAY